MPSLRTLAEPWATCGTDKCNNDIKMLKTMTDCRDAEHSTEASDQESMEEYLEVLTIMEEEGANSAKISAVTNRLGIAQPSVVQMLQKLSKLGRVAYQPTRTSHPVRGML